MKRMLKMGLAATAAFAMSAMAQQPAWKQGMPESMANSTLAPLAAKLTATKAADIDLSRLKLPAGFKIEVWADSVPGVRALAQADNGKFYADRKSTRLNSSH